jgi:hypothetical protein
MEPENKMPIDAIKDWQKQFRTVAQVDEPGETKASRENLHDTENAVDSLYQAEYLITAEKRTVDGFADVISEALCDFTGAQIYAMFTKVVTEQLEYAKKEYLKVADLYKITTGKFTVDGNDQDNN